MESIWGNDGRGGNEEGGLLTIGEEGTEDEWKGALRFEDERFVFDEDESLKDDNEGIERTDGIVWL